MEKTLKMSDRQYLFLLDVALLIQYCAGLNIKITGGEMHRTQYQHDEYKRVGYTEANRSKHQDRMAIDINIWHGDKVMWAMHNDEQKAAFQHIGDFWEGLRPGNEWGGNWTKPFDPTHFQAL